MTTPTCKYCETELKNEKAEICDRCENGPSDADLYGDYRLPTALESFLERESL